MTKTPESTSKADIEWLQLKEEIVAFEYQEPFIDKAKRLIIQHPLIPLGIMATCGSLIFGLRAMVKGERRQSNTMMRYRVFFQAVTIAAITLSSISIMKTRQKSTDEEEKTST